MTGCLVCGLVSGGHLGPQESGQLPGDGDGDHVAAGLAGGQAPKPGAQALLGGPGSGCGGWAGLLLAPAQGGAQVGAVLVAPGRLDQLGAQVRVAGLGDASTVEPRRNRLTTDATAQMQQLRDLLECVWPAVLDAAGAPFRSASWRAALAVVLDRCAGDLTRVRRLGAKRFVAAVRAELPRWGATRPRLRIVTAVFDALTDATGVATHRPGALQRAAMVIHDWHATRARLVDTETLMVAMLDELGVTELVCSIPGLSAVGAAAILAEPAT
jgi:hypothetical protein